MTSFGHPDKYMGTKVAQYPVYFKQLAELIPKHLHVLDLFGGVGLLARELWPVMEPESWTSIEKDPELRKRLLWTRQVFQVGDSFEFRNFNEFDVVIIDPERCTLNQMLTEGKWQRLLRALTDSDVKWVMLQEYGAYWCHLPNQQKLYRDKFGVDVTRRTYPQLVIDHLKGYDLNIMAWKQGLGSTYYLFERTV